MIIPTNAQVYMWMQLHPVITIAVCVIIGLVGLAIMGYLQFVGFLRSRGIMIKGF